jgi:hypothetical protein
MTQFCPGKKLFLIVVNVVLGSFVVHGASPIHRDDTALVEKSEGV